MALTSALMALTLLATAPTGTAQSPVSYKLAGRNVILDWPKAGPTGLASEVMDWSGFGFLPADGRREGGGWWTSRDWSAVQDRFAKGRSAESSTTPAWRTKIVVMTRADVLDYGADGVLRTRRSSLAGNQVTSTLQEIARFAALVTAETGGAVRIDPDVAIEEDTLRQNLGGDAKPFDEKFAQGYFRARINGGLYEAEDKIYRGPYNSVIYIHPGLGAPLTPRTTVNGMPVTGVALSAMDQALGRSPFVDGSLARTLYDVWIEDVRRGAAAAGWQGYVAGVPGIDVETGVMNPNVLVAPSGWSAAASFDPIPPDQFAAHRAESRTASPNEPPASAYLLQGASFAPNFTLKVVQDPERGSVLQASEIGQLRMGGATFPVPTSGPLLSLSQSPYLSFWVRSTSNEPMALRLVRRQGASPTGDAGYYVSIGRDAAPAGSKATVVETAFSPNGKWQHIIADLKPLQAAGLDAVDAIMIGPTPNALASEREQLGPIEYSFAEFSASASAEGPSSNLGPYSPNISSTDETERALAVSQSSEAGVLAKALTDPADLVKINAAGTLLAHPSNAAVPALIDAAHSLNQRLVDLSLRALWATENDASRNEVRRLIKASPLEYTRSVAAPLVAQLKDPALAGQMVILFASKSWQARKAGVEAIAMIPGNEPGIILMTFLQTDDPEVRLTATELGDPSNALVQRRMLWSSVNDPSDAVRAASYIKLIESKNEASVKEGLKGVYNDDSSWVRQQVGMYLRTHPAEPGRAALRQAVVNPDPRTRAAALMAMAALEGPVTLEEIGNVLEDKYPVVQLALIELASKKGLTLPKGTLDILRNSTDPLVVEKAKALGG